MKQLLLSILIIPSFAVTFGQMPTPVAHYNFNGNTQDQAGSMHLLAVNAPPFLSSYYDYSSGATSNPNDQCIVFHGDNALVTPDSISNFSWTECAVSFWCKNMGEGSLFQFPFSGQAVSFSNAGDNVSISFDGSSAGSITNTSQHEFNDGDWHHIFAQNNGSHTKLYIDGSLDASTPEQLYTVSSASIENQWGFGSTISGSAILSGGSIDEFMIFKDTLSNSEILSLAGQSSTNNINETDKEINITLFPNPTNGELYIQTSEVIKDIKVTDINGRLLTQTKNVDNLNLAEFENGIYLIKIETENGTFVSKLIKK